MDDGVCGWEAGGSVRKAERKRGGQWVNNAARDA